MGKFADWCNKRDDYWICDPHAPRKVQALGKVCNDKVEGRNLAVSLGMRVPELDIYPTLNHIDFSQLPENVVIKPDNNWSGNGVFVIKGNRELLRGVQVDRNNLKDFCIILSDPSLYKYGGHLIEKPNRILVEGMIQDYDPSFSIPRDFKVYVAGGKVHLIQVIDRGNPWTEYSVYNPSWEKVFEEFQNDYLPGITYNEPPNLKALIEAAETIAKELGTFMRVDFYMDHYGPVFGEFTPSPFGGNNFSPEAEEFLLGLIEKYPDDIPEHWSKYYD